MLLEDLKQSIQDMEEIRNLEQAANDMQKQNKTDSNYASVVIENDRITNSVDSSVKYVEFKPSVQLVQKIKQVLEESKKCIETGFAQDNKIKFLSSEVKSTRDLFSEEWGVYYKNFSEKKISTLTTVQSITPDKEKTGYVIKKIQAGGTIDFESGKNARLLSEGISEGDKIIQGLGLNDEILDFLDKVSDGRAQITDLTDTVTTWIQNEDLLNKFNICFADL